MTDIEKYKQEIDALDSLTEKIIKAFEYSEKKLLEEKKRDHQKLVVSVDGEIKHLYAWEIEKMEQQS